MTFDVHPLVAAFGIFMAMVGLSLWKPLRPYGAPIISSDPGREEDDMKHRRRFVRSMSRTWHQLDIELGDGYAVTACKRTVKIREVRVADVMPGRPKKSYSYWPCCNCSALELQRLLDLGYTIEDAHQAMSDADS